MAPLSKISKIPHKLISFFVLLILLTTTQTISQADPIPIQLSVFCFRITDIEETVGDPEGDSFSFEFEVLNWSDDVAYEVYIATTRANGIALSALPGGSIDFSRVIFDDATVDMNGRPLTLRDVNGDMVIDALDLEDDNNNGDVDPGEDQNGNGRLDNDLMPGNGTQPNDWMVSSQTSSRVRWEAGTPIFPIDLLDINPVPPFDDIEQIGFMQFTDPNDPNSVIPETIDDGDNVLDGFVFTVDNFDVGKVFTFNWFLLNSEGDPIGRSGSGNPYGFGTVSIARVDDGPFPGAVFAGNSGFQRTVAIFFDSIYNVPDPSTFVVSAAFGVSGQPVQTGYAAEFGAGITAPFLNEADNLWNVPVNTTINYSNLFLPSILKP
jgi:hypothetical protein